jgi:type I restriction enzyme, S subunit
MKDGTFTADRLLALYDRVAEAEDAIPRLRRFVMDLAVRGKLVEQDPSDEPAAELLKRIAKEKARLVKAGGLRANKAAEPAMVEAPFDLPFNWAWAAIGTVFIYDAGDKRDPKELDRSLWLLELEDVEKDTGRLIERITTDQRESQSTKSQFRAGDILYGKLRPYLNKVLVADEPGYSTTEIVALRPYLPLCSGYCALALRRPDFVEYVTRLGQGTKMPRLRTEDAVVAPFPLPPLAEQQRIVAKVDELMALCDRLQAVRAGREAVRDRLTAATLTRLTAPETDAETFPTHARFALQTLPTLTTRPDQIKTLRQTILNLAVQGKLVEQDPTDEPAAELLKRIAAEKAQKVRAKELRTKEIQDDISFEDAPYMLPSSWAWTRLGTLCFQITDGAHHTPTYIAEGVPFLSVKDVSAGSIDFGNTRYIAHAAHRELARRCNPERGDMLLTKVGTTGIAVLIDTDVEFSIFVSLALLKFSQANINGRFLQHLINSPFVKQQSAENTQGIGNKNLVLRLINQFAIPLPPLAEQHRIVAKVDALMALCDQLESSLTTTTTTRSRLLEALLHEALSSQTAV